MRRMTLFDWAVVALFVLTALGVILLMGVGQSVGGA